VAIKPEWTAGRCLEHIRAYGEDSETIHWLYVVDADWKLIDDIELRKLILTPPETRVAELMDHSFICISAHADREEAVRMIQRYDVVALPVVDSEGVLLGIVTVDDVLDVAEAKRRRTSQGGLGGPHSHPSARPPRCASSIAAGWCGCSPWSP
jgi:magnesium transporter